jgi:tetratricopeptide (TPR) repeat protein
MWICRSSGMILFAVMTIAAGADVPSGPQAVVSMAKGLSHERAGEFDKAVADFTAALAAVDLSAEDRVRAFYDRGVALDAMGRTLDAVEDYSRAISRQPHFTPALNNRANAYRRLGRFGEAERDYRAALSHRDAAAEYSWVGLGWIAESRGKTDEAREDFRKALAIHPGFKPAADSLAGMKGKGGARAAVKPDVPGLRLGEAHLKPGELEATRKELQKKADSVKAELARLKAAKLQPAAKPQPAVKPQSVAKAQPVAGGVTVQVGAFRSQAEAEAGWKALTAKAPDAVAGLTPVIVIADLPGKGRYFRLRTAVANMAAARRLCVTLATKGHDCMIAGK